AGAERPTAAAVLNHALRATLLSSFRYSAFGALTLFGVAACMWTIMTSLPTAVATVIFSLVPALILAFGAYLSTRPQISRSVVAGVIAISAVALIAGAVVAALVGAHDDDAASHSVPTAVVIGAGR